MHIHSSFRDLSLYPTTQTAACKPMSMEQGASDVTEARDAAQGLLDITKSREGQSGRLTEQLRASTSGRGEQSA